MPRSRLVLDGAGPARPARRAFGIGAAAALLARGAGADDPAADALNAARAETAALRAKLEALERDAAATQAMLDMALGAAPFRPATLSAGQSGDRLKLPPATRVDSASDSGRRLPMAEVTRGKSRTVLVFWATWCKPCTSDAELAHVADLRSRLDRRGAALISLSADALETVRGDPRAPKWVYPYWQLEDAHLELLPRAFIERRGVGLPLILVLDASGAIRWIRDGALDPVSVAELVIACGAA